MQPQMIRGGRVGSVYKRNSVNKKVREKKAGRKKARRSENKKIR